MATPFSNVLIEFYTHRQFPEQRREDFAIAQTQKVYAPPFRLHYAGYPIYININFVCCFVLQLAQWSD